MVSEITKMNRPRILFMADKWCAGKKEWGISEWESNLFLSLKELEITETEIFHFDEYYDLHQKSGDRAFLKKIEDWKPDLIFFVIYKTPGTDANVPKWSTIKAISNEFKIPIVAMWGDLELKELENLSISLLPFTELNIGTASETIVKRIQSQSSNPKKYIYLWVPKNPKIFNDPNITRDIDVSYVGSPKGRRLEYINYLSLQGIQVKHGGGERLDHFTTEEYSNQFKRSKMTLSFSRAANSHVINARPFEAMACGAMVLEEENFGTPKLFIPYVDYIPYSSNKDLAKKIKYYLQHDDERKRISRNGKEKMETLYSSEKYWRYIIDKIICKKDILNPIFSLSSSDLSKEPIWTSFKLKFLDFLCSHELGFKIFSFFFKRCNKEWLTYQINKIIKK